jgi:hypothetical protein
MYVTVVVFGAGVLHHAPSRCHIHVVQGLSPTHPLNLNHGRTGEVEITLELMKSLHRKGHRKTIGELIFA